MQKIDIDRTAKAIKESVPITDYLEKSGKGKGYNCPFCGSGTGPNGTGAVMYYPEEHSAHCFSCGKRFDVLELYGHLHSYDNRRDFVTILKELGERTGNLITASDNGERPQKSAAEAPQQPKPKTADFTKYYAKCRNIAAVDKRAAAYMRGRGIKTPIAELIQRGYDIGFDPAADPANAPGADPEERKAHPCPRMIFPTSRSHYVGRSIDPQTDKAYAKMNPNSAKGGRTPNIYHGAALWDDGTEVLFVTEGALDALSIAEAGEAAIALNSTSNAELLLSMLKGKPTKATLVLLLDNDEAGKAATAKLESGLSHLNISYTYPKWIYSIGKGKDANELLQAEREQFITAIQAAAHQTKKPDNTADYLETMFVDDIERFRSCGAATGFANLDAEIKGIYPGLYVIAAVSSLGKSTFALQLADNIAAAGTDVLFFALEMSRFEMVSKSLARIAYADFGGTETSLDIRRGRIGEAVLNAKSYYSATAGKNMSIIEGNFRCDISLIREYVRSYIDRNGGRPVVFLDYLQIIQPETEDTKKTTRETVDHTITELKRMSRELGITVFVISSLNRSSYAAPVELESLKESGGIEYTADVIWGLQFAVMNSDPLFNDDKKMQQKREKIKAAKDENPRKIQLSCLKNRYGRAHFKLNFDYYSQYDYFTPGTAPEASYSTPKAGHKA